MNPFKFARVLLIVVALLLSVIWANAQSTARLPDDWKAYLGNSYSNSLFLLPADSAATVTAKLYYDNVNMVLLPPGQQPVVTRQGRYATFSWALTRGLPAKSFLEISLNGSIRFVTTLLVSKTPTYLATPASVTVVNPAGGGSGSQEIALGDILPPSLTGRLRLGASQSRLGQRGIAGGFQAFAFQSDLLTGNINETTNLYFTTVRARSAFSANTGLSYNPTSGQFGVNAGEVINMVQDNNHRFATQAQIAAWDAKNTVSSSFTGVAANAVGNRQLRNAAITPEKTSFIRTISKNLFNTNSVLLGYYINNQDSLIADAGQATTGFIKLKPSTDYYINGFKQYFTLYDGASQPISTTVGLYNRPTNGFRTTATTEYGRFTVPANVYDRSLIQIEEGTVPTQLGPFYEEATFETPTGTAALNLANQGRITASLTTGLLTTGSRNLYNKYDRNNVQDTYITSDGLPVTDLAYTYSNVIPVTGSLPYAVSHIFYMVWLGADGVTPVGGGDFNRVSPVSTAPANAFFARVSVPKSLTAVFMFSQSSTQLPYEEPAPTLLVETPTGTSALTTAQQAQYLATSTAQQLVLGKNLYNKNDSTNLDGKFIDNLGNQYTSSVNSISHFIRVKPLTQYSSSYTGFLTEYNDKYQVIGTGGAFNRNPDVYTTRPDGVFVKLTIPMDRKATFQFQEGPTIDPNAYYGAVLAQSVQYLSMSGVRINVYGTSIPASGGHIEEACARVGAILSNQALGSSPTRVADRNGSWAGMDWHISYSLAQDSTTKNFIVAKWDSLKLVFTGSPPTTLSPTEKATIKGSSWHKRLLPYLNGTLPPPDIFLLNAVYNGQGYRTTETDLEFASIPTDPFDRNYEVGAINFIIKQIQTRLPDARIAFIGHYEKDLNARVSQAELTLASYWGFPILKLWEHLGLGLRKVPNTQQYWSQAPFTSYGLQAGESTAEDMDALRWNLKDRVHLNQDPQRVISHRAAGVIAWWLPSLKPR